MLAKLIGMVFSPQNGNAANLGGAPFVMSAVAPAAAFLVLVFPDRHVTIPDPALRETIIRPFGCAFASEAARARMLQQLAHGVVLWHHLDGWPMRFVGLLSDFFDTLINAQSAQ
jgi:hypothetical protein